MRERLRFYEIRRISQKSIQNLEKKRLPLVELPSEKELGEKLAKLGTPISLDVIEVYLTLGGMKDYESDETLLSFWNIDRILEENEPNSEFVSFADFLIDSHWYWFKYETEFVSSIHIDGKNKIEKIADSFEEFFENYLINPEKYYLFEREENEKEKKTTIQL